MKELNLGHSDFKDIIQNDNYFVDKSMLIEEVLNSQKTVLLFSYFHCIPSKKN